MVGSRQTFRVVTHQIWNDYTYAVFLVIQHDGSAAGTTSTKFQRAIWVVGIKWLALQLIQVIYHQIIVIEENHMRGVLAGNTLANRAVTGVVINWIII